MLLEGAGHPFAGGPYASAMQETTSTRLRRLHPPSTSPQGSDDYSPDYSLPRHIMLILEN